MVRSDDRVANKPVSGRAEIGTENASYDPNDLSYVLITMLPIARFLTSRPSASTTEIDTVASLGVRACR